MKNRIATGVLFVSLAGAFALTGCQSTSTAEMVGVECCCTEKGMECMGDCGCACESCATATMAHACCCTEKGNHCSGKCGCACESCA